MSKVTIEFDTKTKDMAVAIDGKSVENANCVSIYPSYSSDEDEYRLEIGMMDEDEENEIKTFHRMVASEQAVDAAAGETAIPDLEGFKFLKPEVKSAATKATADIHEFFAK